MRGGGLKFGMLMFLNSTRGCLVYDGRGLMGNGGSSFCNTKSVTLRHSAKLQGFGRDTCMIWGYRRGRWAVASLVFESLGCWRVVGWGGGRYAVETGKAGCDWPDQDRAGKVGLAGMAREVHGI